MAIVKMKKLKLLAASAQREELLRELMLLGCVEVSDPPAEEAEETPGLGRVEAVDLPRLRTEHAA